MSIPIIGKAFSDLPPFLAYLDSIQFGAWRPRYVVMHHTGAPDLKTWNGWQTRKVPVTDEQWMRNLAAYYGSSGSQGGPADGPWQHGPHFFFTPTNYCAFSLPTVRGTHAKSFNADSWAVECVGDFDVEPFDGALRARYIDGLAALHLATGLQPSPYQFKVRGLHFHRDDPLTSKTCPGNNVKKPTLVPLIETAIRALSGNGDHPDEKVVEAPVAAKPEMGRIMIDDLNVRGGASAKAPVVTTLKKGAEVSIVGSAMNGTTRWLKIDDGEWVAARFVSVPAA